MGHGALPVDGRGEPIPVRRARNRRRTPILASHSTVIAAWPERWSTDTEPARRISLSSAGATSATDRRRRCPGQNDGQRSSAPSTGSNASAPETDPTRSPKRGRTDRAAARAAGRSADARLASSSNSAQRAACDLTARHPKRYTVRRRPAAPMRSANSGEAASARRLHRSRIDRDPRAVSAIWVS